MHAASAPNMMDMAFYPSFLSYNVSKVIASPYLASSPGSPAGKGGGEREESLVSAIANTTNQVNFLSTIIFFLNMVSSIWLLGVCEY